MRRSGFHANGKADFDAVSDGMVRSRLRSRIFVFSARQRRPLCRPRVPLADFAADLVARLKADPFVELYDGQAHVEARASALRALGLDPTAVRLREFPDEREADAESAVAARGGAVGLPEAIPDVRR